MANCTEDGTLGLCNLERLEPVEPAEATGENAPHERQTLKPCRGAKTYSRNNRTKSVKRAGEVLVCNMDRAR